MRTNRGVTQDPTHRDRGAVRQCRVRSDGRVRDCREYDQFGSVGRSSARVPSWSALVSLSVTLMFPCGAMAINCSFVATTGVSFGSYDVFASVPTDSSGSITYRCKNVKGRPVRITLGPGGAGTYATRQMRSTTDVQQYNLYLDAARTTIWGDGTGGSSFYQLVPTADTNITVVVYGRVPAGQDIRAGTYVDSIVATMNW